MPSLRFDVITLFPELFTPFLNTGVTRRAFVPGGPVDARLWPLRDHATDAYRRVDDRPYGGGPGMVLLVEPLSRALSAVRRDQVLHGRDLTPVILFSPAGRTLDQALVRELAAAQGAVLVCGRYEGVDQRFIDAHVDMEISLGDFVLSGAEIPALALLDAVARLQPGVLNDQQSHEQDSFSDGLLDHPHYSRPDIWSSAWSEAGGSGGEGSCAPRSAGVPPVLLSGNHAEIARWRRERQLELTARRRPDLIQAARAQGRLDAADEAFLAKLAARPPASRL
jgi:tRNA (guanine37-N1)-methyltransferase